MPKANPNKRNKTKFPGLYYRIKQNLSGRGSERVYYGRIKQAGVWREVSLGRGLTLEKARKKRQDIIDGIDVTPTEGKNFTLERLSLDYGLQNRTDRSRYSLYLQPYWMNQQLHKITTADLKRWKAWLKRQDSARGKRLSDQTVKHCLNLLSRIMKAADLSVRFPVTRVQNRVTEDFTPIQIQSILQASKKSNKDIQDILMFLLQTGIRRGEICKLQWQDIDFNNDKISLRDAKSGKDEKIPMSSGVRRLLQNRKKISMHVFPGARGKQRNRDALTKAFRRLFRRAGISDSVRPMHSLRHWYATELVDQGVDILTVSKLLTHKDISTTQRYLEARDKKKSEAAELMTINIRSGS